MVAATASSSTNTSATAALLRQDLPLQGKGVRWGDNTEIPPSTDSSCAPTSMAQPQHQTFYGCSEGSLDFSSLMKEREATATTTATSTQAALLNTAMRLDSGSSWNFGSSSNGSIQRWNSALSSSSYDDEALKLALQEEDDETETERSGEDLQASFLMRDESNLWAAEHDDDEDEDEQDGNVLSSLNQLHL